MNRRIYSSSDVYTRGVAKHLVDIDETALTAAQAEPGTDTIRDTVNTALRRAGKDRKDRVNRALDVLAMADLDDRTDAWR